MPISEARRLDFSLLYRVCSGFLCSLRHNISSLQIVVATFEKKETSTTSATYRECIACLFVKNLTFNVTFLWNFVLRNEVLSSSKFVQFFCLCKRTVTKFRSIKFEALNLQYILTRIKRNSTEESNIKIGTQWHLI